jgi:hypothetical protein
MIGQGKNSMEFEASGLGGFKFSGAVTVMVAQRVCTLSNGLIALLPKSRLRVSLVACPAGSARGPVAARARPSGLARYTPVHTRGLLSCHALSRDLSFSVHIDIAIVGNVNGNVNDGFPSLT